MPWTAIATGASGLFSGLGSYLSGKDYLKGVRETNEQNYKIWQEQQQHNVDMFNLENDANIQNWQNQFDQTNAYNSASAQRQRLEEAGLNPTLMMNGGNAGIAQSSGVAGAHVNPSNAPTMQAPQPVENGWTALAQGALQGLSAVEDALDNRSQRNERDAMLPKNLEKLQEDIELIKSSRTWQDLQNKFGKETYNVRRDREYYTTEEARLQNDLTSEEIKLVRAQIGQTNLDVYAKEKALQYFDEQQLLQMQQQVADIMLRYEQRDLTAAQVKKELALAAQSWAFTANLKMQTALGWQQYGFNQQMNPLLLAGQTQDNLATFKDNQNRDIDRFVLKSLFPSIIEAQKWGFKFSALDFASKVRMAGSNDGDPNFLYNTITGFNFLTSPFQGFFQKKF